MNESFIPCTPLGIKKLIDHYQIEVFGKRAVIMGRSRIVGRPAGLLLDKMGATVTNIHKRTPDPKSIIITADILVVATGVKHLITGEDVKKGAVVIDVGIHRNEDGSLTGDVDFESLKGIASAATPVPGGVGPLTVYGLMENTFKAFCNKP